MGTWAQCSHQQECVVHGRVGLTCAHVTHAYGSTHSWPEPVWPRGGLTMAWVPAGLPCPGPAVPRLDAPETPSPPRLSPGSPGGFPPGGFGSKAAPPTKGGGSWQTSRPPAQGASWAPQSKPPPKTGAQPKFNYATGFSVIGGREERGVRVPSFGESPAPRDLLRVGLPGLCRRTGPAAASSRPAQPVSPRAQRAEGRQPCNPRPPAQKPRVSENHFEDLLSKQGFSSKADKKGPRTIAEMRRQDQARDTDPLKLKVRAGRGPRASAGRLGLGSPCDGRRHGGGSLTAHRSPACHPRRALELRDGPWGPL